MSLWWCLFARRARIQYLKTSIDEEQRREFGQLVETAVEQIGPATFSRTAEFAFRKTDASAVPIWAFALGISRLMDSKLIRRAGAADLIGLTN